MNDNLSSMITPKNLVKDNLSRVMPLRSKGVVMVDHFIRARWKIMKFDFFIFNVSLLAASQTVNFASSVLTIPITSSIKGALFSNAVNLTKTTHSKHNRDNKEIDIKLSLNTIHVIV